MKREQVNKPHPTTSKSSNQSGRQGPPVTGLDLQVRRTLGPIRAEVDEVVLARLKQLVSLPLGSATQQAYVWLWLATIYHGMGMQTEGEAARDNARTLGKSYRARVEVLPTKAERPLLRKSDAVDEEAVEALYRMHFPEHDPNALDIVDKALALPVRVPLLKRRVVGKLEGK